MNGPDHYREAGKLIAKAQGVDIEYAAVLLAEAQVHATLAQAAATAEVGGLVQWGDVTGRPVTPWAVALDTANRRCVDCGSADLGLTPHDYDENGDPVWRCANCRDVVKAAADA